MKRCPHCNKIYLDDSLIYCLNDGTALIVVDRSGAETLINPDIVEPQEAVREASPINEQSAQPEKNPPKAVDSSSEDRRPDNPDSESNPIQPKTPLDSAKLPDNSAGLSKDIIPSRRKHFVPAVLIGLALGLIIAAILARYDYWVIPYTHPKEEGAVYIFGGGTVHTYLTKSGFFEALRNEQIPHRVMQGPTGTGAELFPHVYKDVTFIVMASRKLEINELQSVGKPQAVFEAYLGPDPLQMLFVGGRKGDKDSVLYNDAFKDILTDPSKKQLDFTDLRTVGKWVEGDYAVYTGTEDAGTRAVWGDRLPAKELAWWPDKLNIWDIRSPYQMIQLTPTPRIYLGSEVLFRDPIKTLEVSEIPHKKLDMVDGSKGTAARGLYLYGFIDNSGNPTEHVQNGKSSFGYHLPKSVVIILKHVYKSNLYLFDKNKDEDKKCLELQINHFHLEAELESEIGWVNIDTNEGGIFRAKPCTGQPEG